MIADMGIDMDSKQRLMLERLIANKIFSELDINYLIDVKMINTIEPTDIKEVIQGDIIPELNNILLRLSNGAMYL